MRRRDLLGALGAIALWPIAAGCAPAARDAGGTGTLTLTREQWRALLAPERFAVLFEERTERPWSSPLNAEGRAGTYICAACFQPLFDSRHKYESNTGWPSFTEPLPGVMGTRRDFKLIVPRTEYHCRRCGGHQGHVFDDGPPPRGQRWCNNGLALIFVPADTPLPALRG